MKEILVVVNGSYHPDGITSRCLDSVSKKLAEKYDLEIVYHHLDDNIKACVDCGIGRCKKGCCFQDQFQSICADIEKATHVLIGTPVYLDFPTPKLLAFLSRLNSLAESTGRKFFEGKNIHIHANAYCSGTKACIGVLMSACEMLGFTISGRSTTEYIELWRDNKIRGGMSRSDCSFLN